MILTCQVHAVYVIAQLVEYIWVAVEDFASHEVFPVAIRVPEVFHAPKQFQYMQENKTIDHRWLELSVECAT